MVHPLHPPPGAVLGARPHHQRHQWGFLCRLLLHLLPEVNGHHWGFLLPPELWMVNTQAPGWLTDWEKGLCLDVGQRMQEVHSLHLVTLQAALLRDLSCKVAHVVDNTGIQTSFILNYQPVFAKGLGCMVWAMALGCIAVSESKQTFCLFPVLLIMLWINTYKRGREEWNFKDKDFIITRKQVTTKPELVCK